MTPPDTSQIKSFLKLYWFLLFCVVLLAAHFPFAYFSNAPIIGNDLEDQTAQATQINSFFHTWWNENGAGGSPAYLYYPPVILLFSFIPIVLKVSFFLSFILLPVVFYRLVKRLYKNHLAETISTLLFTYFLLDKSHQIFFPGVLGVVSGLFTNTLALFCFFIYWEKVLQKKQSPFLLSFIILTNPIVGFAAVILTIVYWIDLKHLIKTGVMTFLLTAWWLVPYFIYTTFFHPYLKYLYANYGVRLSLSHKFIRLESFLLTPDIIPLVIIGLVSIFFCKSKRMHLFFLLIFTIVFTNISGWYTRISQFLIIIFILYGGFFFTKVPKNIARVLIYVICAILIFLTVIFIPQSHSVLSQIYDTNVTQERDVNSEMGYYFSIKPPYQYHASDKNKVAFSPFGRSTLSAVFRVLKGDMYFRNGDELYTIYNYFHITRILSSNSNIDAKYDFYQNTSHPFVKEVVLHDKFPFFVLPDNQSLQSAETIFTQVKFTLYNKINQTGTFLLNATMPNCISNFTQQNNDITFQTNCLNQPHVLKRSYHPLWYDPTSTHAIYDFENQFMVIYPTTNTVSLRFGPTWWMKWLYVFAALPILYSLARYYKKRKFILTPKTKK